MLADQCDKLAFERCKYCQLSLTDDVPVYHAESTSLLTTRCDDRRAMTKFSKSRVWDIVSGGRSLIIGDTRISL